MPVRQEQRFIQSVESVEFLERDLGEVTASLENWLESLGSEIRAAKLASAGLINTHPLARQAGELETHLQQSLADWAEQWAVLKPTQALADSFDDKVMLLVFGKFNAGKSSFCNFLAERFIQQGRPARYFQFENGQLAESDSAFTEGSTETTSRLQGVVLGEKLLLLDTPGLHSVTPENAALTQRYTDSADGVLWLTSSTSPGQVQELDELARELRRNKPLLPVVTRSDYIEEDEVDGELCKLLCNKSADNRALQEQDVQARAAEKLRQLGVDIAALRPPVSVSCHAARAAGQTREAMQTAGFERLYDALLEMVGPALRYKQRQPAEMLLHHFEENVLGGLFEDSLPRLAALTRALEAEHAMLGARKAQLARRLWREVAPTLPELLQRYGDSGGVQAVSLALTQQLDQAVAQHLPQALAGYAIMLKPEATQMKIAPEALQAAQLNGRLQQTELDHVYGVLESALHASLEGLMKDILNQCETGLDALALSVQDLRDLLQAHAQRLLDVKRQLRA